MPYVYLSSIEQNINQLWDEISDNKYWDALKTADKTLDTILKYYTLRGKTFDEEFYHDKFHNIKFILKNCNGKNKKRILYQLIGQIKQKLNNTTTNPLDRIREIYEEIRDQYLAFFEEKKQPDLNSILSCLEELNNLKPKMEQMDETIYNLYSVMMQKAGECQSILPKLTLKMKSEGTMTTISNKFGELFRAMQRILTPPKPISLAERKGEIYGMIKSGVSLSDIAARMGIETEALETWLRMHPLGEEYEKEGGQPQA